jgi:4'-phosphopantetheinyl transferase
MNSHWFVPANHPPLASGEAHIWAVPLDPAAMSLDSFAATLSPEELQRAADLRLTAPRQRFVMARAALRILLGRYLHESPGNVTIIAGANTKPRLGDIHDASNLRFNVAHSDKLALIAVTTGCEIGVDIERVREVRHAEHIAKRYFHPAEIAAIVTATPADRDAAFLRCWTGKEAVLKAIGTGISGALSVFHIPDAEDHEITVTIDVATHSHPQLVQCSMRRLDPDDDYLGAVAVVGPPLNVRRMAFTL